MRILLTSDSIEKRIAQLASEISDHYRSRSAPLLVGVLKGSLHFLSDLSRRLTIDHTFEFIRVSTYPDGTDAKPASHVEASENFNAAGKDILVIDDVLDQGHTARAVKDFIESQRPRSIQWALLLVKEGARDRSGIDPDFVGFEIPQVWVVGYGMDLNEKFRHLKDIREMDSSTERSEENRIKNPKDR